MKTITEMTTAEMIAEYNAITGKSIKKFSSRAAGEKQLAKAREMRKAEDSDIQKMIDEKKAVDAVNGLLDTIQDKLDAELMEHYGTTTCPCCGVHLSNGIGLHGMEDGEGKTIKLEKHEYFCLGCGGEFGPELKKKAISATRSDAIAESWQNAEVAASRSKRDKVSVDGVEYNSTRAAFRALGLDEKKHIQFRGKLKKSGKETFEQAGKQYVFMIVSEKNA